MALFIKSCEQNAHEPIFYGIKNKFKKILKKCCNISFYMILYYLDFFVKGEDTVKVRSSVKPICEKCKVIKRKGLSELSVKIQSTNSVRDNDWIESE